MAEGGIIGYIDFFDGDASGQRRKLQLSHPDLPAERTGKFGFELGLELIDIEKKWERNDCRKQHQKNNPNNLQSSGPFFVLAWHNSPSFASSFKIPKFRKTFSALLTYSHERHQFSHTRSLYAKAFDLASLVDLSDTLCSTGNSGLPIRSFDGRTKQSRTRGIRSAIAAPAAFAVESGRKG
jgi:hypothetical protein